MTGTGFDWVGIVISVLRFNAAKPVKQCNSIMQFQEHLIEQRHNMCITLSITAQSHKCRRTNCCMSWNAMCELYESLYTHSSHHQCQSIEFFKDIDRAIWFSPLNGIVAADPRYLCWALCLLNLNKAATLTHLLHGKGSTTCQVADNSDKSSCVIIFCFVVRLFL